jgi:tetratricopeptide (TPR) repeat protein
MAALLCHLPALGVPFVGDDTRIVVENPSLRPPLRAGVVLRYERFRPLTNVSYACDTALAGRVEARAFHRTNLALHAAVVLLLYLLVLSRGGGLASAGLAAGLVALHPIFLEGPAYVSARGDLLAALFVLTGLLSFRTWVRGGGVPWLLLTIAAWLLGSSAKEIAALLPALLLLEDTWLLRGQGLTTRLRRFHLPLVGILAVGGLVRVGLYFVQERGAGLSDPGLSVMTQVGATWRYLRLLLVPEGQTILHVYPQATSWLDLGLWVRVLGVGALIAFAFRLRKRAPELAWGLAAYLLVLAPTALIPLDEKLAERRAYLPLALLLAGALPPAWAWASRRVSARALVAAGLTLLLLLGGLSHLRYRIWEDPRALWRESTTRGDAADPSDPAWTRSPLNATPFNNLGAYAYAEGDYGEAERSFSRALALNPSYSEAYANRAAVYLRQGALRAAEADLRESIRLTPRNAMAHTNLALLCARRGRQAEAEAGYARALELQPTLTRARAARGRFFAGLERWSEARADLERLLADDPDHEGRATLVAVLLELGDQPAAREVIATGLARLRAAQSRGEDRDRGLLRQLLAYEVKLLGSADPKTRAAGYRAVLAQDPGNRQASYELALLLAQGPDRAAALRAYDAHLRRHPQDALAWRNCGRLKARSGDGPGALADLSEAVRLNPRDSLAWLNRGQVQEALGRTQGALVSYGRALEAKPSNGRAALRRGLLFLRLNQRSRARADLQRAVKHLPPQDPGRLQAAAALGSLR